MSAIKTIISKILDSKKHAILPAAMMPWRATIKIPSKRLTLAAQFEKLAAICGRAGPDSGRLAQMQSEATVTLETATFALDRVLEDLAALNLTMPSLAAYISPIASSLSGSASVAAPSAAVDAGPIKQAA